MTDNTDSNNNDKQSKPKRKKSRRETGYTKPTRSRYEVGKEVYDRARAQRKKCRESNPSASTCPMTALISIDAREATEDWTTAQRIAREEEALKEQEN